MSSMFLRFALLPFLLIMIARGNGAGDLLDEPAIYFRIVKGIEQSSNGDLKPFVDEKGAYSYHIKSVTYLGYVAHHEKRYYVAEAFFIRSSPKDKSIPPARGHRFLLVLDAKCRVVSCGRHDSLGDLELEGDVLMSGNETCFSFANTEPSVRHNGWAWGDSNLPYAFEDRISDKDWESGAFREKDKKAAEKKK